MTQTEDRIVTNPTFAAARPRLSILMPFKGDDPTALLEALERQGGQVELLVLDDGSRDGPLAARVADCVSRLSTPACFYQKAQNLGRARGRNFMADQARADHLLFLDSDMLPDDPSFIARWLDLIDASAPQIAFGGFSLNLTPRRPEHALHRFMALQSDCHPSDVRQQQPEKHVFTSNLLVSRALFAQCRFDESFVGWGWEDVEWGMRAASLAPIVHIENTATHLGLDTVDSLIAKYRQSASNFSIVAERHPSIVAAYPSFKVARMIGRLPLQGVLQSVFESFGRMAILPLRLRSLFLRLFRASLYARVLPG